MDAQNESSSMGMEPSLLQAMDYNKLKIRVLLLFEKSRELSSDEIREILHISGVDLADKALKMALMRYTRQGLLSRTKKIGRFRYQLTEKGSARRDWLSKAR